MSNGFCTVVEEAFSELDWVVDVVDCLCFEPFLNIVKMEKGFMPVIRLLHKHSQQDVDYTIWEKSVKCPRGKGNDLKLGKTIQHIKESHLSSLLKLNE